MIKRLRRKFVVMNMGFISLILIVVLSGMYIIHRQDLQTETELAMRRSMRGEIYQVIIGEDTGMTMNAVPVFSVRLDLFDHVVYRNEGQVIISEDVLSAALKEAFSRKEESGILKEWDLRYLIEVERGQTLVAFADLKAERQILRDFLLVEVMVGAGTILAFLGASLLISRRILKPVETTWRQQQQFLADASHELKTPLTVILANTGILLSHKDDTVREQVKWVEYIDAEAARMKKLVDDMLFLAKSDLPKAPAELSDVDLSQAVMGGLLPFESVAFEEGKTFDGGIEQGIHVMGVASQLRELTVILTDNAMKYAGDGGTVEVNLRTQGDKAVLSVRNTGDVISPEHLEHLFDRFYRVDKARSRDMGGYGLGLAIAKSIVEGHGGRIRVESNAETGTVFSVTLPLK